MRRKQNTKITQKLKKNQKIFNKGMSLAQEFAAITIIKTAQFYKLIFEGNQIVNKLISQGNIE